MSVSTKELFTAFFKGLAFAKGLNFGEKNRGMAEDRWITIHPGGDPDVNRRIEINDETGEIEKGLGAGTNIKDLSKTLKAKKNGEEAETTSKQPKVAEPKKPEQVKAKKTEEKKKPEAEKKVKFNVGNINYEFTEEEAEKQLRYNDKYIPESEKELKEFTEKKKTIDKERETVEPLDKFYSDYKKALDKFDDDSYLAAASYFNKYKDRFGYLKGQALKTVKNDTRLDHNKTEQRQKEYSEKAKDLFRQSSLLRDQIESSKNDIKQRTDVSNSLRKALAQDSLDLFINNVNIER